MCARLFHIFIFLIWLFFPSSSTFAQSVSRSDEQEIKLRAKQTVELFQTLLNSMSYELSTTTQRQKFIQNALSGDRQIFRDENARIAYDIDPESQRDTRDEDVQTYLNNFDVFYQKSYEPTIAFSDYQVSPVFEGEGGNYYIKVKYISQFQNKHKDKPQPYQPLTRIAELIATRNFAGWNLYLVNIRNFQASDNTVYRELDFTPEYLDSQFGQVITNAVRFRSIYLYEEALEAYQKAYTYKRLDSLEQRMIDITEILDEKNDRSRFFNINDYRRELTTVDNDPDLYLERGLKYMELQSYTQAIVDFQNVIRITPTYVKAHQYLAEAYEANKQPGMAIQNYQMAYQLYPENTSFLPRLVTLLFDSDRYADALPYLEMLIGQEPGNLGYVYQQAEAFFNLKKYDDAVVAYQKLLEQDPDNTELLIKLSEIEKLRGNMEKSVEYLSKTGKVNPSRSEEAVRDFYAESINALKAGDTIQSELLLTQFLKLQPESTQGWLARAEIYEGLKEWEKAIIDYNQVLELEDRAEIYLRRGRCFEKIGAFDTALESYKDALKKDPSLCEAYRYSAMLHESMEQPAEAASRLEAFLSCGQGSVDNYLELIQYYFHQGNLDKAREVTLQAERLYPNSSSVYVWLGKLHIQQEEYIDAVYALKTATKNDEDNAEAYYLMYKIYQEHINPKKAQKYYNKAVDLDRSYREE